jgi:predicted RNA-binding protein YlqC (UPF0109 family)
MPMSSLIGTLVRALVDHPDEVQVTETKELQRTVIHVKVAPQDIARVVGRQGRTARALRTVLDGASRHSGSYWLNIEE